METGYKDKYHRPICVADIVYYTERPYSNYADSIGLIYENEDKICVGTLIVNSGCGKKTDKYINYGLESERDLELEKYAEGWECGDKNTICTNLEKLEGVNKEMITVEWATRHFPLDK